MVLKHTVGWDARFMLRSPWFWPLSAAASQLSELPNWPSRADLNAAYRRLNPGADAPALCFADNVRKASKRTDDRVQLEQLYDGRIAVRNEVPTRERDWHDFFNALCFATFPLSKRALHRRQFGVLEQRVARDATRLPPARTPEQDALTLFDEGGVLIAADEDVALALAAAPTADTAQLPGLCAARRARVVPFGHALFEHLVEGLRCPGGYSLVVPVPKVAVADAALLAAIDARVAQRLVDPNAFQSPRDGRHFRLNALLAGGDCHTGAY